MVLAKDRSSRRPLGWRIVLLGSSLLGLTSPGCAKLQSMIQPSAPPASLGTPVAGRDAYSDAIASRGAALAGRNRPTDGVAVAMSPAGPMAPGALAEVDPAVQIRSTMPAVAPGLTLGDPVARTSPTVLGVPNGSRMLASAERSVAPRSPEAAAILAEARQAIARWSTYQVELHRQERVGGNLLPEEDVVLAVRRQPRAVRLSWVQGPHKGREVLYRSDEPGGLIHINLADSALPVPRLNLPPESPMVMKNSRHPITEAGYDSILDGIEAGLRSGGPDSASYAGLQATPPLDHPHHLLVRTLRDGEVVKVYLDPASHLPALVEATASNGDLLERYLFLNPRGDLPELAVAAAFDPDARWGAPRGLFGRLARGNDPPPSQELAPSPR